MWSLKYGINEPIYKKRNRLADIENRLVFAKRKRVGERKTRSLGLADANCYM